MSRGRFESTPQGERLTVRTTTSRRRRNSEAVLRENPFGPQVRIVSPAVDLDRRRNRREEDFYDSESDEFSPEDYTVSGDEDVVIAVRSHRRRSRERASLTAEPVFINSTDARPAMSRRGFTTCECTRTRSCVRHAAAREQDRLRVDVRGKDSRRERSADSRAIARDERDEIVRDAFKAGFEAGARAEREMREREALREIVAGEREAVLRSERERLRVLEGSLAGAYARDRLMIEERRRRQRRDESDIDVVGFR